MYLGPLLGGGRQKVMIPNEHHVDQVRDHYIQRSYMSKPDMIMKYGWEDFVLGAVKLK